MGIIICISVQKIFVTLTFDSKEKNQCKIINIKVFHLFFRYFYLFISLTILL